MYTNCLLLGLDSSLLGITNGMPKTGLFRHSNPRLGEMLLHFILSALRGPAQAAKDFDKVWPIFDASQSRDFRKLSVYALREVHKRTFPADVAASPFPDSLTDISYLHAASLLPVTKARIVLERRKFLKNANDAVQRQATWSALAHDMTAEFRSLCAEEAYLQQELEKLHDLRNKAMLDGELWDGRLTTSLDQNSHLVSKATRLWDSLLSRRSQHEVLASGPIEDLIAHREHRLSLSWLLGDQVSISGSSLLAAMDQSSQLASDILSDATDLRHVEEDNDQNTPSFIANEEGQRSSSEQIHPQASDEETVHLDDRAGKAQSVVDVAEILRCWTHALQRIHKQSLILAKSNDGEGPELLRCTTSSGSSGHAESLSATLAEHRQHLASVQVLIGQLKEVIPSMQESISELKNEVNGLSVKAANKNPLRLPPCTHPQGSGRTFEENIVQSMESNRKAVLQPEQISSSPALKLPHLFSLTPNSSGKSSITLKRQSLASQHVNKHETESESSIAEQPSAASHEDYSTHVDYVRQLKQSVRVAALKMEPNTRTGGGNKTDATEHYFISLSAGGHAGSCATSISTSISKLKLSRSPEEISIVTDGLADSRDNGCILDEPHDLTSRFQSSIPLDARSPTEFLSVSPKNVSSNAYPMYHNIWDGHEQAFSPPFLLETSFSPDTYEDLLAPFSEIDDALMER